MNRDDPELEKEKERYEQGDKAQLLYWLNYCITNHRPMPAWLEEAFQKAYHAVRMYEIKSWDEVFGKPLKKGARQASERRNMKISEPLFYRVRDRYAAGSQWTGDCSTASVPSSASAALSLKIFITS